LQKGGLAGLPGGVEYPIELVTDIPVQLGANQPLFRREHIVIYRVTGAGGVKKPHLAFIHGYSITGLSGKVKLYLSV
jgi:hypothetical protein